MPRIGNQEFHETQQQIPRIFQDAVIGIATVIDYNVSLRVARIAGAGPIRLALDCRGSVASNVGMFGVDIYEPLPPGTKVLVVIKRNDAYIIGVLPSERWPTTSYTYPANIAFTFPVDVSQTPKLLLGSEQVSLEQYRYYLKTGFANHLFGLMPGDYALTAFTGNRFVFNPFNVHIGDMYTHLGYSFFDQTIKLVGLRLESNTPFHHHFCYSNQHEHYHLDITRGCAFLETDITVSNNPDSDSVARREIYDSIMFYDIKGSLANEGHIRMLCFQNRPVVFENIGMPGTYMLVAGRGILIGVAGYPIYLKQKKMPYEPESDSYLNGYHYNVFNKQSCAERFINIVVPSGGRALYPEVFYGKVLALSFERFVMHTKDFLVDLGHNAAGMPLGSCLYIAEDGSIALINMNTQSYIALTTDNNIVLNCGGHVQLLAGGNVDGLAGQYVQMRANRGVCIGSANGDVSLRGLSKLNLYGAQSVNICSDGAVQLSTQGGLIASMIYPNCYFMVPIDAPIVRAAKSVVTLGVSADKIAANNIAASSVSATILCGVVSPTGCGNVQVDTSFSAPQASGCPCPCSFGGIRVYRSIYFVPSPISAPASCCSSSRDNLIITADIPRLGDFFNAVVGCSNIQANFRTIVLSQSC